MQLKYYLLFAVSPYMGMSKLSAQPPELIWQHCYGGPDNELGYAAALSSDGNYFVAGVSFGGGGDVSGHHGAFDGWLFKTEPTGKLQWQLCLGTGHNELMSGVFPLSDGGCIVSGLGVSYPGGNNDCGGSFAFEDFWLLRLSDSGEIVWQECYGGSNQEIPNTLAQAADGGFFMAGFARSTDGDVHEQHGEKDVWVIKTNATGNLIWSLALGGSANEEAFDVVATLDGGCIVAAQTTSTDGDITNNHGGRDAWIIKLSSEGEIVWQRNFGGSENDEAVVGVTLPDGGFIIACNTQSDDIDVHGQHGESDIWIVKLDGDGSLLWEKCYGGTEDDFAKDILAMPNGNFIITGESVSEDGDLTSNYGVYDFWLFEIDPLGNLIWQKSFGGSGYDYAQALVLLPNGEFLLAGETTSNDYDVSDNHGDYDAWLGRFSSSTTGLSEIASIQTPKIFPNPASSEISIEYELAGNSEVTISLLDFTGRQLGQLERGKKNTRLCKRKSEASGIYRIRNLLGLH